MSYGQKTSTSAEIQFEFATLTPFVQVSIPSEIRKASRVLYPLKRYWAKVSHSNTVHNLKFDPKASTNCTQNQIFHLGFL